MLIILSIFLVLVVSVLLVLKDLDVKFLALDFTVKVMPCIHPYNRVWNLTCHWKCAPLLTMVYYFMLGPAVLSLLHCLCKVFGIN